MANNVIKRVWNQNRMVAIEDLNGMTFQAESGGHTFQISGVDDAGNTVALTGSVAGVFLRPDNTDVAITGSACDGVASVTLPANCYDVPGRFGLTVFVTADGQKTAVYAAIGTVSRTSSGAVSPGTTADVVDLINQINAAVATIPASWAGLMADIAPTYSASAVYPVGSYVYYNGDLYRCTTAITTAESWTAGHWTQAVLGNDVSDLNSALAVANNLIGIKTIEEIAFNAYTEANTLHTNNNNSPFVYYADTYDYTNALVSKIKIKAYTPGTFTIGTIKKVNAVAGQQSDRAYAIPKATLNIANTGLQTIDIPTPFSVNADEYFFVGLPSDTCVWVYGGHGTNRGFLYVSPSGGKWTISTSGLGLDIYVNKPVIPTNIRESIKSIYDGKTLSILGDSISTFDGYIPEGNATYYPHGTVTSVTDTWWKKLIDALGMTLNVNNSWSGSRVTTTVSETSAGCMRCENLGESPDVIIVWMGINDFNNEVVLGTYNGTTALPSNTTTFREAYAIMLNKILTKYQTSEVWVCTLPQCERNAESGFPEINGNGVALAEYNKAILELAEAFGVKVLNHNKSGLTYQNMPTYNPDNLHPNKLGHSLIANNDIREMDATISKRYAIA